MIVISGNVASFRKQPDKWIPAAWTKPSDRTFHSELKVQVANRMGVLAQIAAQIAAHETNIHQVNVEAEGDDTSLITLEVEVRNRPQLSKLIRAIRSMPDVLQAVRSLA